MPRSAGDERVTGGHATGLPYPRLPQELDSPEGWPVMKIFHPRRCLSVVLFAVSVVLTAFLTAPSAGAAEVQARDPNCAPANRVGTNGDDVLNGNAKNNRIDALAGNDTVSAAGGSDKVCGGPGNDKLFGGDGNDQIWGGDGNDELHGQAGNDQLHGQAGADRVDGGPGDDTLGGGPGDDQLNGGPGNDTCNGGPGNDTFVNCEVMVQ
jgi:Ca2+-binding RTX toxin-like protein